MSYGHAHLLTTPRCTCGRPIQVREDNTASCARCALHQARHTHNSEDQK